MSNDLIKLLREQLDLSEKDASDDEILEATKGTYLRANIEAYIAMGEFRTDILKILLRRM